MMKLRYINPAAKDSDIQIPAIQVAPMIYGDTYEIENETLVLILLHTDHWERVEAQHKVKSGTTNTLSTANPLGITGTVISADTPVTLTVPLAQESDLRQIHGIGARTAKALNAVGISNLSDLIGLTALGVSESLGNVAVETVAGWQSHARQLMEE